MSQDKQGRSKAVKALVDIVAGTIAGINVTLVGHPFDTLKVRLQTQPQQNPVYSGLVDCFKKTVKWEGFFKGLYKGVQAPLVGQMFFRANLFLAFGESKRFLSDYGKRPLKIYHYYMAGGIGWGFGCLAECPFEFIKTQMQIQIIKSKTIKDYVPEFTSMTDCFKKIVKTNGIFGAYQGFVPHMSRNVPAGAVHLGTFEYLRLIFAEKQKCKVSELPILYNMLAGSTGGVLFWALFFPLDVLKSATQGDSPYKEKKRFKGIFDAVSKLWAEGGISRFYKGFTPCMLRSIPANAVLLYTSSYLSEHL